MTDWLTQWLTDWLMAAVWCTDDNDWLIITDSDWVTHSLTYRLTDWLSDWLTDWLTDWQLSDGSWLANWLMAADWLTDCDIYNDWLLNFAIMSYLCYICFHLIIICETCWKHTSSFGFSMNPSCFAMPLMMKAKEYKTKKNYI